MRPITITSNAKIAPANGVPKTDAKPALIPAISTIFLSILFSLKSFVNWSAIAPPTCTAVPSRPAEPPNKCVRTVPKKTKGAILKGITFLGEWYSSNNILFPFTTLSP